MRTKKSNRGVRRPVSRALLASGTLAVTALMGMPAAHAATGDLVAGAFVRQSTSDPTECFAASFGVSTGPSGTTGTFVQFGYRCDGSGDTGNFVIADIDCLVVSGRQAAFAGAIVFGGGIFADFAFIRAGVMDLSPGRPDTAVTGRSRTTPPCALVPAAAGYGAVESGEIIVISGS